MDVTMIDMNVIKEIVSAAVVYVLLMVLSIVLGVVGKAAKKWLEARAAAEEADKSLSEESESNMFLSKVADIIDDVVNAVGQVLVAGVKGSLAWTDEVKKTAFNTAYTNVEAILGQASMERLAGIVGDTENWLISKIEAAVLKNKGKWSGSAAYNIFKEKMEKLITDAESEPRDEEKEDNPSVSSADSSPCTEEPLAEPCTEISDAAYEAATYEGTV